MSANSTALANAAAAAAAMKVEGESSSLLLPQVLCMPTYQSDRRW